MSEKAIKLYQDRIDKFQQRIGKLIFKDYILLEGEYSHSKTPVPFKNRLDGEFKKAKEGESWGEAWDSAWFHLKGKVPEAWRGAKVVANLDFNGEGLIFSNEGVPLQGITNGSVFEENHSRSVFDLYDACEGGEDVELWVEAAANSIMGVIREADPADDDPRRYGVYDGKVNLMRLCVFDEEVWRMWLDVRTMLGLIRILPENSVRHARVLRCVNQAIDAFGGNVANAEKCRKILSRELSKSACASELSATAVGHAHIDTGWLWPVRETIRKCARTFSSQIGLIEKYPDYVFGASQAQHYAFTKEHYPELYEKIKTQVKAGRWEVQGGMWVEADCNLISGESMVRQFLHGKNFFMDEFGVDVNNLWLPDVFGYSAAMPQILRKSGCEFFLTQKISWSQFNVFPHNTFKWRGIDGSEVISHFPPENNYNSQLNPEQLDIGRKNFSEKGFLDGFVSLFGIGDGGGGPKDEHIEYGIREKNLEGTPKVSFGTADSYFESLRQYEDELATWVGELYLELHRGTLTTQARVKRFNRKLERKLREVEFVYSCLPAEKYPLAELDTLWKTLLINQFHDIIPGSSITRVYDDVHSQYEAALKKCEELLAEVSSGFITEDAQAVSFFNILSCEYTRPLELPEAWGICGVVDENGNALPVQHENGRTIAIATLAPMSFTVLKKTEAAASEVAGSDSLVLENDLIKYEFQKDGTIASAYDKEAEREILVAGKQGNVLSLYEDQPNNWDAWDIDIFYEQQLLEMAESAGVERCSSGPVKNGLKFSLKIGNSLIEQEAVLAANSKRIEFKTKVDWRENHRMLRVAFPVNLLCENASFDIQYGYIKRNTHRNTSWDMAKFEVAAHRYVDMSEQDYGVALMNDCKYGHKVYDNMLDLNLLRSPSSPDPDADKAVHHFTYALLPHCGNLLESKVMAEAEQLNQAPVEFAGVKSDNMVLPCRLESDGISLEVLKKAEKEDCLILRMVENQGRHSSGKLYVESGSAKLVETNLMEWTEDAVYDRCGDGSIELKLTPFEIKTFKLKR